MFENTLRAILATMLCGASLLFATRIQKPVWLNRAGIAVFLILAAAMFQHLIPGFHNVLIFNKVRLTESAVPFTMYLNFDKLIVGLIIYIFYIRRFGVRRFSFADLKTVLVVSSTLIALFVPLSMLLGFVRFEPKVPERAWVWALNNLLIVCFAEEALFRGFLQAEMQSFVARARSSRVANVLRKFEFPIVTGALLFGLAHYKGGATYMGLAFVAGLFYGYAYKKTGKIAVSILVHFLLNATHFFLFTYPVLS